MHVRKIMLSGLGVLSALLLACSSAFAQQIAHIEQLLRARASESKATESLAQEEKKTDVSAWIAEDMRRLWRQQRFATYTEPQDSHLTNSNSNSHFTELTAREKFNYAFERAFLRPSPYIWTGVSTVITQLDEEYPPHKDTGDKVADGLSRYAIKFATRSSRSMLVSGIYPIIFDQDPRYRPSNKQGFKSRLLYAVSRVFVTEGGGGNLQPNISRLGGSLTASGLANLWERNTPGHDRIGVGPTFKRFGSMIALDMVQFILLEEFGPDIKKKVFKR
jgi:hypothetical protein